MLFRSVAADKAAADKAAADKAAADKAAADKAAADKAAADQAAADQAAADKAAADKAAADKAAADKAAADKVAADAAAAGGTGIHFIGTNVVEHFVGTAYTDWVTYAASTSAVTVNLLTGQGSGGFAQGDTYVSIEGIHGSKYNDTLIGDDNANIIYTNNGNDTVSAGGGNDKVVMGEGFSKADGGAGTDLLSYGSMQHAVTVDMSLGQTSYNGVVHDTFTNFENLDGSIYNDVIIGNSGNNIINGGAGDDTLTGGLGKDTFFFSGDFGHDKVTDFTVGQDKVRFALTTLHNFADVMSHAEQTANGVLIHVDGVVVTAADGTTSIVDATGAQANGTVIHDTILLQNLNLTDLHATDFVFI